MRKIAFHNLGCKVNAYETEQMIRAFSDAGFMVVPFTEPADVVVVNTCTVTNIADRKSRQMLHKARRLNPAALVVAAGCYVDADAKKAAEDEAVDLVVGNAQKNDIVDIVLKKLDEQDGLKKLDEQDGLKKQDEPDGRADSGKNTDIDKSAGTCAAADAGLNKNGTLIHTRAFLKIQDGCNQFCSYCLIPYVRGRITSREDDDVEQEAKNLALSGYKEIVLTGIHLGSYGRDRGDEGALLNIIKRIAAIDGIERIRLGSLEPKVITEEFVREIAQIQKVCPHFHLSLQSGCDSVLRRMNRRYTAEQYARSCEFLRSYYEHPAITTDVIVGFPGETEEEFETTRAFLERIKLYETHIFKYSRRAGTVADRMDGQLTEAEKARRSDILLELNKINSAEFRKWYSGREEEVLLEEEIEVGGERFLTGYTREYVSARVPASSAEAGSIVKVKL